MADTGPDGLLVVDKPTGWTSHDVVGKLRRRLRHPQARPCRHARPRRHRRAARRRRLGHPAAAVPVGVDKAYRRGRVRRGDRRRSTPRARSSATYDMAAVTADDVRAAAAAFVGDIEQIPPMVSAVKVDGRGCTSWPAAARRWSARPGRSRRTPRRRRRRADPLVSRRRRVLGGHLRAHPRRRPRHRPRRGRPPAQPAPHAVRLLHPGGGGAARSRRPSRPLRPPQAASRHLAPHRRRREVPARSGTARCCPATLLGPTPVTAPCRPVGVIARRRPPAGRVPTGAERCRAPPTVVHAGSRLNDRRYRSVAASAMRPSSAPPRMPGPAKGLRRHHRRLRRRPPGPSRRHRRGPRRGRRRGLATAVVTFDRHPAQVVRPESAPLQLTDLDQELELLAATGVDHSSSSPSTRPGPTKPAEDFVREVLVGA